MHHLPEDDDRKIRPSLFEVVAGIAIALIAGPGVIWWIGKLVEIARITLEVFR